MNILSSSRILLRRKKEENVEEKNKTDGRPQNVETRKRPRKIKSLW